MPAAKRSSSSTAKSSSSKPAAKRTSAAAKSGTKATATSTRKAASRTSTQAKSGATKTSRSAASGASSTRRSAKTTGRAAASTAKTAGRAAADSAKSARSGAKATASAAKSGAKSAGTTARGSATRTRKASGGSESLSSVAEQLTRGLINPRDVIMLTRDRIQETLDEAASRGRVTRKDANDLVSELVRRGRAEGSDLLSNLEGIAGRSREQITTATQRARKADSVDRIVRAGDRARRTVGVGPSFPILGYDDLNASQIQSRLGELSKPELRKVLTYERNHAARKSVVGRLEKAIG
ncbi:MAG: hypothetical protein QOF83_4065 [Solirubrobacteraceae bacterium]|jgi:polyhydroxyalkanoate synthesis regulator phasin|nr:hypothetical protein [Solirubrobacteraceae bacterium]